MRVVLISLNQVWKNKDIYINVCCSLFQNVSEEC